MKFRNMKNLIEDDKMYKNIISENKPDTQDIRNLILNENEKLIDVTNIPLFRGDNTISINHIAYDVNMYDQCVTGNTTKLYQTANNELIICNQEDYDVIYATNQTADRNVTKYQFIPAYQTGGTKMIEKVVGTTFRFSEQGEKHYTEFAGIEDKSGDVPTLTGKAILIPEPTNPYDPNAVLVIAQMKDGTAFNLGYLPKGSQLQQNVKSNTLAILHVTAYSEGGDFNDAFTVEVE